MAADYPIFDVITITNLRKNIRIFECPRSLPRVLYKVSNIQVVVKALRKSPQFSNLALTFVKTSELYDERGGVHPVFFQCLSTVVNTEPP